MSDDIYCKDCVHFEPDTSECRVFSPTNVDSENLVGVWPIVNSQTGWCGQFDSGEDFEFIKD